MNGPVCECGFPLRLGSIDPMEGEYWWCSRCGKGPYIIRYGTFAENIAERERDNRPANEDRLRGIV